MRGSDGGRGQHHCGGSVADRLQIVEDFIEPAEPDRGGDLFPNDNLRAAGFNEPEHLGPQMAFVGLARLLAGG